MRLITILCFVSLGGTLNSCNSSSLDLDRFMLSSWQTSYIKITMPTYQSSDTTSIFEDSFQKPGSVVAQSTYHFDKTFEAWYLSPEGKQMNKSFGNWATNGDSLILSYTYNKKEVNISYFIEQRNDEFSGKSISDWDNDGIHDDTLIMRSRKILLKSKQE